jgi:hypothetical protein
MIEFIQEHFRSFIRSHWFLVVMTALATLPLVPMCVQLICAPLHYLSGGLFKVLLCGWALAIIACWGRRAMQDPDKRGCEATFLVTTLKWTLPVAGIILVNDGLYMLASGATKILLASVGVWTTVFLSLLGFALAWAVAARPGTLFVDTGSSRFMPLVKLRGHSLVTHDLRSHNINADCHYRLTPLPDEITAQICGYGELQVKDGHCLVITRGKDFAVWQVRGNVRVDKDSRWHARVRKLPANFVTWHPVES